MSDTTLRDQAATRAKTDPDVSLKIARNISDPWYRTQALAWALRFKPHAGTNLWKEALHSSSQCVDAYQKVASSAWIIAAMAEKGEITTGNKVLADAMRDADAVTPVASKAEALFLLLQAASSLGADEIRSVQAAMKIKCPAESHWRCKRAIRDAERICNGTQPPRSFFW